MRLSMMYGGQLYLDLADSLDSVTLNAHNNQVVQLNAGGTI